MNDIIFSTGLGVISGIFMMLVRQYFNNKQKKKDGEAQIVLRDLEDIAQFRQYLVQEFNVLRDKNKELEEDGDRWRSEYYKNLDKYNALSAKIHKLNHEIEKLNQELEAKN